MKALMIIVLAAAGLVSYNFLHRSGENPGSPEETAVSVQDQQSASNPSSTAGGQGSGTQVNVSPGGTAAPVAEQIQPKRHATPGIYYMVERVSRETHDGVVAAIPGEKVNLLARKANGVLKVTNGFGDFEVTEKQVTDDPDLAEQLGGQQPHARTL